jgi:hypothetical protein
MNVSRIPLCSFAVGLLLLSACASPARAGLFEPSYRELNMRHEVSASSFFNSDDMLIGGSYRHSLAPRHGLGAVMAFHFRPYEKDVRRALRTHVFMQMHERRYAASLALDKEQAVLAWLAIFGGLGFGYTFADFDGTSRAPDEGGTPLAEAGFCLRGFEQDLAIIVRLAYRYVDLRGSENHWVYVALGVRG